MCVPKALCPAACGTGTLGDPCARGTVHAECGACGASLTCVGGTPDSGAPCKFARDCIPLGFAPGTDPACVGGACAWSTCAQSCATTACPDGYTPTSIGLGTSCWCVAAGKAKAGEGCPVFNGNADADSCGPGLTGLGIKTDPTTAACTKAADCPVDDYAGAPDCVAGHCGSSFCSPRCDADNPFIPAWQ